jgi:hypothetical protein
MQAPAAVDGPRLPVPDIGTHPSLKVIGADRLSEPAPRRL